MSADHKDYQPSTPLIPRRLLFGNPNLIQPKVSLDGKYIAFISPRNEILNIYVAEVPDENLGVEYGKELIKTAKPITEDKKRGIRDFHWSFGNQIIFAKDKDGDEDFKLHSVDVKTLEEKILTPFDQTLSYPVKFSARFPDEVIVAINKPDPAAHSLYRVHLRTGELRLIEENKLHFSEYFVNDDLEVVFAAKQTDEAGSSIYKKVGNGVEEQDWKLLITFGIDDVGASSIISIAHDAFYLKDSRGKEFNAIYKIKLDDDELNQVLVAEPPSTSKAEIGDVLLDPITHEPIALQVNYLRKEWFSISPDIFKDLEFLMSYDSSQDGAMGKGNSGYRKSDIIINSQSLDNQAWTVVFTSDIDPTKYYYFDRKNKKLRYLFSDREDLKDYNLSPMWPVVIKARDGLELVSYLTIPVDKLSNKDDYRPTQPLPLVLNVHGGPWWRDSFMLRVDHQFFANRGYAVLSVNYRGSTGLGKTFLKSGNAQWSRKMHDDLIDAVEWAISGQIAIKNKIAIYGGSYGGYATLVGLTFTNDVFACGIDIVGPSNLVTLLKTIPPYWKPMFNEFTIRIGGNPETEEGREFLTSCSPLTRADNIIRPLLIAQGQNDPRVKRSESDQIVEKLVSNSIPVGYILYTDEGHGFARPANSLSFYSIVEKFLARYLDGRYEEFGNAFEDAKFEVLNGKEILGLD